MDWHFYCGSYSSEEDMGLCRFTLDKKTGVPKDRTQVLILPEAKYLAQDGPLIASACKKQDMGGVCLARREKEGLTAMDTHLQGSSAPCYAAFINHQLITATFHDGCLYIYDYAGGTLDLKKKIDLGPNAGCHQVLCKNDRLLIPCLKKDCILILDSRKDYACVDKITFPAGSGPRHGVWNKSKDRLWVVGELSNRIYEFIVSPDNRYIEKQNLPILTEGHNGNSLSAAIRLSPDEQFLIVSTRGSDTLTTWSVRQESLELIQQISCGGLHPRDFCITPDGCFVVVANRDSNEVVCLERDTKSGLIGQITGRIKIPEAVSLLCLEECK